MHFKNFEIDFSTDRLRIRTLHEEDDLQDYLGWMKDQSNKFILSTNPKMTLEDLNIYVKSKFEDPSALLLGVFELENRLHIGNIKFEPIDLNNNFAVVGILIGNKIFRGKGIAQEVLTQSCIEFINVTGISRIILGVDKANLAAIAAYSKCGFITTDYPELNLDKKSIEMVLYPAKTQI